MPDRKLLSVIRALNESGVDFIVVGGVAAVLQGAPVQTFDLDVVYSRDPKNIDRLLAALNSLDAVFRIQPERRISPNRSHHEAGGRLNLLTPYGPLDLLGSIGSDLGYDQLAQLSTEMEVGGGIRVSVLGLEAIISIKEQLASEKDLAVLPVLRRTLDEIKRR